MMAGAMAAATQAKAPKPSSASPKRAFPAARDILKPCWQLAGHLGSVSPKRKEKAAPREVDPIEFMDPDVSRWPCFHIAGLILC